MKAQIAGPSADVFTIVESPGTSGPLARVQPGQTTVWNGLSGALFATGAQPGATRTVRVHYQRPGGSARRTYVYALAAGAAGAIADYETAKKNLASLRERLRQPNTPPSASPGPSSLKSGRYHMRANEYPSDVILTVNGSAFEGKAISGGIERPIRNGVISGDVVTFHLDMEGFPQGQDYKGRIQGGKITGTFTGAPYAPGARWWAWGLDLTPVTVK